MVSREESVAGSSLISFVCLLLCIVAKVHDA